MILQNMLHTHRLGIFRFAKSHAGSIFASWGIHFDEKHDLSRGCPGVVPHLGPHLAEIVTIDEGNPNNIPDFPNLINLKKKILLANSVLYLR